MPVASAVVEWTRSSGFGGGGSASWLSASVGAASEDEILDPSWYSTD